MIAARMIANRMLVISLRLRIGSGSIVAFPGSMTGSDGWYILSSDGRCFIPSGADSKHRSVAIGAGTQLLMVEDL